MRMGWGADLVLPLLLLLPLFVLLLQRLGDYGAVLLQLPPQLLQLRSLPVGRKVSTVRSLSQGPSPTHGPATWQP